MSTLSYSLRPVSAKVLHFNVGPTNPPQFVRYEKDMILVEEAVSILLCSGMSLDEVFRWLERRLQVGRFARRSA